MKKVFRYLLIGLLVIVVAAGGFAAFVAMRGIPDYTPEKIALAVNATPERIAKGRKLSSMLCNGCHMDANTGKLTGRAMDEVSQYLKYNVLEIRDDVIKMVSGQEIDITIDEEFRAGQGTPKTKEEIYSAMIVLGFLSYNDGYLKIPNKELMLEFEKALRDKSFGYV